MMVFHLAIPCRSVVESKNFYVTLGAVLGREYPTHAVLRFFDSQLVIHQSGLWDKVAKMYPRHFGVVVDTKVQLDILWDRWKYARFLFEEYFVRHQGMPEEHCTFFLKDPTNNIIEFKWYRNKSAIFN